ncbi:hypothetical protein Q9966_016405, partial [Columba livia]
MEGTSVLSPSWWEKRRAWARQSRSWRPTAPDEDDVAPNEDDVAPDEDEVAPATRHVPELPAPDLDDVFLEGSPSRKIETWLQECGSLVEEPGSPGPLGCGNNGTSFEDDLTLGAEALLLLGSHEVTGRAPRDKPPSVASSGLSSLPTKTSCSVAAVLAWRQEDAEEILVSLGFAHSEPGAMARVPPPLPGHPIPRQGHGRRALPPRTSAAAGDGGARAGTGRSLPAGAGSGCHRQHFLLPLFLRLADPRAVHLSPPPRLAVSPCPRHACVPPSPAHHPLA